MPDPMPVHVEADTEECRQGCALATRVVVGCGATVTVWNDTSAVRVSPQELCAAVKWTLDDILEGEDHDE